MDPKTIPSGARSGLIVERVDGLTRIQVFTPQGSLFEASWGVGRAWVRVRGRGIAVKDTAQHRLTFSEREGSGTTQTFWGRWLVKVLEPTTPTPGIDGESARRIATLCARYAKDVAAYHRRPFGEITIEQMAEWVAASGRAGELPGLGVPDAHQPKAGTPAPLS